MNGADASTTFTDSSTGGVNSPHTMTANGDAQIDTAQSKFGGAAGLFDGVGDYLSTPDSADWDMGTGDYTFDFWIRWATTLFGDLISRDDADMRFGHFADSTLKLFLGGSAVKSEAWSPSTNTWYHIAVTRSGTSLRFFVDGTQLGSPTTDSTDMTYGSALNIGKDGGFPVYFNSGWLDELRISKGVARWTANFTPPSAEYS